MMVAARRAPAGQTQPASTPIPLTPVVHRDTLRWRATAGNRGPFGAEDHALIFRSGRYALLRILRDIDLQPGDEVLVPAYHCPALLAPIEALQAKVVTYDVDDRLNAITASVDRAITPRSKAIVVVHFFGFWSAIKPLRDLAASRQLVLIEDCAHVSPLEAGNNSRDGGAYRFGSYMKFAPTFDGGFALARTGWRTARYPKPPGLKSELRAGSAILERAATAHRLGWLSGPLRRLLAAKDSLRSAWRRRSGSNGQAVADPGYQGYGLSLQLEDARPSRVGHWLLRRMDWQQLARRRRQNYAALVAGLGPLPGTRLLKPELGADDVPYVLPLRVERAEAIYQALRAQGIPLYRWDSMRRGSCAIANRYATELLQVPCHQDLNESDLQRIIAAFTSLLQPRQTPSSA